MNDNDTSTDTDIDTGYRCAECDTPIYRNGRHWAHWIVPSSHRLHQARPKQPTG